MPERSASEFRQWWSLKPSVTTEDPNLHDIDPVKSYPVNGVLPWMVDRAIFNGRAILNGRAKESVQFYYSWYVVRTWRAMTSTFDNLAPILSSFCIVGLTKINSPNLKSEQRTTSTIQDVCLGRLLQSLRSEVLHQQRNLLGL
jgi:hypothetical protein